jgi:hypothetical protein
MTHHCHAFRCKVAVPPAMFMCRKHWFMLPIAMRNAVWREYQPGQEERKVAPTKAYFRVTDEAENYVAAKEGLPLPHPSLAAGGAG